MQARFREAWERVKAASVDVLTEGIRLAQIAGEHLLQRIAERELRVPPFLQGVLERFAGRERPAPREDESLEFVCKPAGPDAYECRPAGEAGGAGAARPAPAAGAPAAAPKVVRRKAPKRASKRPPAPRRPRKKATTVPPKPAPAAPADPSTST
jgi:hypothetical protein